MIFRRGFDMQSEGLLVQACQQRNVIWPVRITSSLIFHPACRCDTEVSDCMEYELQRLYRALDGKAEAVLLAMLEVTTIRMWPMQSMFLLAPAARASLTQRHA